jgi:2-polyprenyl-3-methyl-5-hydroxy-6-metoxy-1,4-benzoquinol methylase
MPDFSRRALTPEMMDGEVDYATFRGCLVDLAKVNVLTLAYRPTLAFLKRLHREGRWPKDRPLTILDVGSGHGDMLRKIDRWAARRRLAVSLTGLDLNPWSAQAAKEAPAGHAPIRYLTSNLFDYQAGPDVVISSLFTHHLDDVSLIRFIEWQESNANICWFINDLQRHPFPYYGFALLARLMRWHPFVQNDGPVSISRAFTVRDWRAALAQAGATQAVIEPWFPFRLCVSRVRR